MFYMQQHLNTSCYGKPDEDNAVKREISINRRRETDKSAIEIVNETQICNNCNILICQELRILENDPTCMRLNVLSQTLSRGEGTHNN